MSSKDFASSRLFGSNAASLVLAASLISIWALIAYDLERSHDRAFYYAHIQLENLTEVYAEEVSSSIKAVDYVLVDLREEWKNNPEEFAALIQHRQTHLDPSVAFNVGIINEQGKLAFASAAVSDTSVDLSDRPHFRFHLLNQGDELYISKPVLLRSAYRLAIQFSRPLPRKDGEFNGVIVASVSPEYFYRFHENIDLGKGSSITLARTNGDLITRSPRPGQAVDTTIEDAPWVGAASGESGYFQAYSEVDNVERLYAWQALEEYDLAVTMGQSVETILNPYYQQRRTYLLWGSVATLFLLLLAYGVGRYQLQRAKANAAMQQMEEALQRSQKLEAIGKLTGGVAHDFNNLLQILGGNVELLRMTVGKDKQIEPHLNSMSDAIERGSKLTTQLLTFARRQPLHPVSVNIEKLVRNLDSLIQRLVGDGIEVRINAAKDTGNVKVDPALLESVILNLAANARDAMDGKGLLSIDLRNESVDEHHATAYPGISTGEYVLLAVKDTGSGMPQEVLERVFEPFFTTKAEGKGTGLGLAMAYGFVKESGGHIQIDSKVGSGTTIGMFLPRSFEAQKEVSSAPAKEMHGGAETVLIAEDNAEVRRMLELMLEHLGYRVLKAANAKEALEILKKGEAIDLLFTDVVMPGGMDGLELARKANIIRPDMAILVASGSHDTHESLRELQSEIGDIRFISKPYGMQEVSAAFHELLKKRRVG